MFCMKTWTFKHRYALVDLPTFLSAFREARKNNEKYFYIQNYRLKTESHRYNLFADKGTACAHCGIKANIFIIEGKTADEHPHANLYHLTHDAEGNEIATLFTKDHILPRSLGGPDAQENYQTMCEPCNNAKGNTITPNENNRLSNDNPLKI